MSFNPGIVLYCPPPSFGCAAVFLENIRRFKTRHRLIMLSDFDHGPDFITSPSRPGFRMGDPTMLPPDALTREDGKTRPCAISNAIFHVCLRVAIKERVSHMLYLESDCRVNGDYWDEAIFDEYFAQPFPMVAAGTLFCWNMPNGGLEFVRRWQQLIVETAEKKFPVLTYGMMPQPDLPFNPAVFPNGALGVYSIEWLATLFDLTSLIATAKDRAWDFRIGDGLAKLFGPEAIDLVAHLDSVFSGYGDQLTTEDQRLNWLRDGTATAIHQVKSNKTI